MVGFMGSGKTTVGRSLARHLGWRYADLDEDIESKAQKTIPEIFDQMGEQQFRQLENEMLQRRVHDIARECRGFSRSARLLRPGAELRPHPEPWRLHLLDAPLEMTRPASPAALNRPLARDPEKFEELFNSRRSCYEKAHYRIPVTSEGSSGALKAILELPLF